MKNFRYCLRHMHNLLANTLHREKAARIIYFYCCHSLLLQSTWSKGSAESASENHKFHIKLWRHRRINHCVKIIKDELFWQYDKDIKLLTQKCNNKKCSIFYVFQCLKLKFQNNAFISATWLFFKFLNGLAFSFSGTRYLNRQKLRKSELLLNI